MESYFIASSIDIEPSILCIVMFFGNTPMISKSFLYFSTYSGGYGFSGEYAAVGINRTFTSSNRPIYDTPHNNSVSFNSQFESALSTSLYIEYVQNH